MDQWAAGFFFFGGGGGRGGGGGGAYRNTENKVTEKKLKLNILMVAIFEYRF